MNQASGSQRAWYRGADHALGHKCLATVCFCVLPTWAPLTSSTSALQSCTYSQPCATNHVLPIMCSQLCATNHQPCATNCQSYTTNLGSISCSSVLPTCFNALRVSWKQEQLKKIFVYFLHLQSVSRIKSLYSCIKHRSASSLSSEYALISLARASQALVHTLTPSPSPKTPKFSFFSQIYHDFVIFFTLNILHNRQYIDRQRYVCVSPLLCQLL